MNHTDNDDAQFFLSEVVFYQGLKLLNFGRGISHVDSHALHGYTPETHTGGF